MTARGVISVEEIWKEISLSGVMMTEAGAMIHSQQTTNYAVRDKRKQDKR